MAVLDLHLSNPHDLIHRLCATVAERRLLGQGGRLGDYNRSAS